MGCLWLFHRSVTPSIIFVDGERHYVATQWPRPGHEPGTLDSKSSALTSHGAFKLISITGMLYVRSILSNWSPSFQNFGRSPSSFCMGAPFPAGAKENSVTHRRKSVHDSISNSLGSNTVFQVRWFFTELIIRVEHISCVCKKRVTDRAMNRMISITLSLQFTS